MYRTLHLLSDSDNNEAIGLQTCDAKASLFNTLISKIMSKEEMQRVTEMVTANIINCTKEVLTSDEVARYMGISKSYLYKLTMRGEIPHYKPMGKMCYFNRTELEEWLQRNRVATAQEITERANTYCRKGGVL